MRAGRLVPRFDHCGAQPAPAPKPVLPRARNGWKVAGRSLSTERQPDGELAVILTDAPARSDEATVT